MSAFGGSVPAATAANASAGKRRATPPTYGASGRTAAEILRAAVAGAASGAGGAAVAAPAGAGGGRRSRASSAEDVLGDRLLPPPAHGAAAAQRSSSTSALAIRPEFIPADRCSLSDPNMLRRRGRIAAPPGLETPRSPEPDDDDVASVPGRVVRMPEPGLLPDGERGREVSPRVSAVLSQSA